MKAATRVPAIDSVAAAFFECVAATAVLVSCQSHMPIPLPRGRLGRFFSNPAVYELPSVLTGSAASMAASFRFFEEGLAGWGWSTLIVGLGLLAAGIAGVCFKFAKNARSQELHELHGCLLTLYHILRGIQDCTAAGVRVTVHVVERAGTHFVQALDYVGDTRGGTATARRRFPVQSGISGKAFREGATFTAKRVGATQEAYIQELVRHWHYTERDARRVNSWTYSWMAVPIHDGSAGPVIGVLYLDATNPDFFDSEEILKLVGQAAIGIAYFVGRRYSSN